jgi:nucleotide-binding universal stress UspA family protein
VNVIESTELTEIELKQSTDMLEAARARLQRPDVDASIQVLRGRPATAILDAAIAFQADVIVVGSRGRGTIESMLLGSVSAEVVDHARVPVLVARATSIDRVILAWDGSACADVAAEVVRTWPIFAGSAIRVISVADVGTPWWTGFATGAESLVEEAAVATRHAHDAFAREMADDLVSRGLDAVPERRDGDPATQLIRAAADGGAQLIVLGTHGHTGLSRILMGGVARNVLHHAACSVLVARQP